LFNPSPQNFEKILFDLRETNESMQKIGLKYGIGRSLVSAINQGTSYPIKNYNYPARITK
jgi:hypothetical protein